jgi:hypothetical protein
MSATVFGYLRPHSCVAAHEVAAATDQQLAENLSWTIHDWRDDPDWPCVAMGELSIRRVPLADMVPQQVALLRQKQTQLLAAAQAAVVDIDRQINSLLAIETSAAVP